MYLSDQEDPQVGLFLILYFDLFFFYLKVLQFIIWIVHFW